MESGFYLIYLLFIMGAGIFLLLKAKAKKGFALFGLACLILGFGDAFHLVPRAIGLFSNTLETPSPDLAFWLGIGKLITSITMTIFYVLLYHFIYIRTNRKRTLSLDIAVYALAFVRLILCAFPQNEWTTNGNSLLWGTLRNIPFLALGILAIILSFIHLRKQRPYGLLYLAIILSFGFYLPVVFFASMVSWVGMLMLPKTICYMSVGVMGILDAKSKTE